MRQHHRLEIPRLPMRTCQLDHHLPLALDRGHGEFYSRLRKISLPARRIKRRRFRSPCHRKPRGAAMTTENGGNGASRREVLKCMAWGSAGHGVDGGRRRAARARARSGRIGDWRRGAAGPFSFVQISDTHIGFGKAPNPDARRDVARGAGPDRGNERAGGVPGPHRRCVHLSKPSNSTPPSRS